jgi:chorismate mutase / prephenate dehydratase
MTKKVAYLGPQGTFTEKLAVRLFPDYGPMPVPSNLHTIDYVERGIADSGVFPFENKYGGKVEDTLRSLLRCRKTKICGEEVLGPIRFYVGALVGHGDITEVRSKDQALIQCTEWIYDNFPNSKKTPSDSTALAAKEIVEGNLYNTAAIASKEALGGLEILAEDILPHNRTRFFILGQDYARPTGDDKSLIVVSPPRDESGILYDLLYPFKVRHISLEDIRSIPNHENGGYMFFIEMDGHQEESIVAHALDEVKNTLDPDNIYPDTVRILGSYPNSHWKEDKE